MKLNQRDKLILIVVLVVLIWRVGIMFFIKPAIESVNAASDTLDAKEMELEGLQKRLKEEASLPDDCDKAYKEATDAASMFYPKMVQYEAATEMQNQLDVDPNAEGQEIMNQGLTITQLATTNISRYVFNEYSVSSPLDGIVSPLEVTDVETTPTFALGSLSSYTFQFTFTAHREDIMKFIENLQNNSHRSLVVTNLSIPNMNGTGNGEGETEENPELEGSITLELLMVPDIMSPDDYDKQGVPASATVTE